MSPPSPGAYVYDLTGTTASFTDEVDVDGDRVRIDSGSDRSATQTRSVLSWRAEHVLLEQRRIALSDELVFECSIDEEVPVVRFPIRREDYPRVEWDGEDCSGSADISVAGTGELRAAGRSWRVWRIVTALNMTMRSGDHTFTIDYDETSWWSPELRKEIKRDRRGRGNLDGHETSERVVPVLKTYPNVRS